MSFLKNHQAAMPMSLGTTEYHELQIYVDSFISYSCQLSSTTQLMVELLV